MCRRSGCHAGGGLTPAAATRACHLPGSMSTQMKMAGTIHNDCAMCVSTCALATAGWRRERCREWPTEQLKTPDPPFSWPRVPARVHAPGHTAVPPPDPGTAPRCSAHTPRGRCPPRPRTACRSAERAPGARSSRPPPLRAASIPAASRQLASHAPDEPPPSSPATAAVDGAVRAGLLPAAAPPTRLSSAAGPGCTGTAGWASTHLQAPQPAHPHPR